MITNAKLRSIISREGLEPGQKHCVWCGKPFTPKPGMKPYDTESLCSKECQEAEDKALIELAKWGDSYPEAYKAATTGVHDANIR